MELRKKYFWILGVLVLVVTAGILTRFFRPSEILSPKRGEVVESIYGLGTVVADRVFHMRSGITLSVRKLYVTEGDPVKAGQPLAQLDQSVLRSPIDGTVTMVSYKEGELVPPQVSIVTVTNLKNLYLEVSLEQQSVLPVKVNQPVYVSFESLRNQRVEGSVQSIYPRENQFIVRIDLKNWPPGVLPGMTADVAILVGKKNDVLLIPLRAITAGQVLRIRNGKKEKVPVKLGVIDNEWGEVLSENITIDDELLIRGK